MFKNYDVAISFVGQGWMQGNVIGFGVLSPSETDRANDDDFRFGHLGYDLKAQTCGLKNRFTSEDGFSVRDFFTPKIVLELRMNEWWIGYQDESHLNEFIAHLHSREAGTKNSAVELTATTDRNTYEQKCNSLLRHIKRGDIYEINYCIDFVGRSENFDPAVAFGQLNDLADAPMSVLYKNGDSWLMCASPERYISRKGNKLISQPIKGTIRRGTTEAEDEQLRLQLQNDPKERSENVMIVDLVRNDLSRIANKGSVKVSELFGVYPFKTVHQMISTVEAHIGSDVTLNEIVNATFPMGSMTGAPKISAMKLAEQHEEMSRGIYSGSVGCVLPNGDFDFNVVIRSIAWNASTGHVSAKAGSAITANSVPEKEYEECLLKAKAMMQALNPASL